MFENILNHWNAILKFIKEEFDLTDISYETFLVPLKPLQLENGTLYIVASDNPAMVNIISKKYRDFLKVAIEAVAKVQTDVVFICDQDADSYRKNRQTIVSSDPYADAVRKANLNIKNTFENFVSGKSNELAHAAALAVAENPGEDYKILYIYGGVGLGKTHLMQAIAHYILKRNPSRNVLYVTSETFMNDYIDSIKKGDTMSPAKFREKYRREPDVLLIDDIQFIADKERTQEEFFHTFNALYDNDKQIVITSDKPPKDINNLEERIRSRFEGGLIVDIQVPDFETRMAILRKKEEAEGLRIDDEVIKYIAENIKSNIRILEGALQKLILRSRLAGIPIDVDMAKENLKDMITGTSEPTAITPQKIINIVCEHYGIPEKEFLSIKKNKDIAFPRQIAMYLCCENTDISQKALGTLLGGRDHSTIIHGRDKIAQQIKTDPILKNTIETLNKKIQCG